MSSKAMTDEVGERKGKKVKIAPKNIEILETDNILPNAP